MEKYASYYWKKRTALVRAYKNIWIEVGVGWVEVEEILILSKEIKIILRMIHNIIKIIIIFIVKILIIGKERPKHKRDYKERKRKTLRKFKNKFHFNNDESKLYFL